MVGAPYRPPPDGSKLEGGGFLDRAFCTPAGHNALASDRDRAFGTHLCSGALCTAPDAGRRTPDEDRSGIYVVSFLVYDVTRARAKSATETL